MKILLVSVAYPPEIRSASHLMQELAMELQRRGHLITVATCYPRYNLANGSLDERVREFSIEGGIGVIRIKSPRHHKVNFFVRGISQLLLPYFFLAKLRKYLSDGVDVVLVYSPPLPLWYVGKWVKRICGAKFILNIQDIFPQNAIDIGILNNSLLIKFFERIEKKAYQDAHIITAHSAGNREFLINAKGLSPDNTITLHNWIDLEATEERQRKSRFRERYGLENKFIFFFGGVIGPSQRLDLIIEAAKELRRVNDLVILILGDGTEKSRLQRLTHDFALGNVVFQPFVSKDDYRLLLQEVDVGLVCLSTKNKTPVVPGKILGYMAAGLPVLAFLNRESDGHHIIRKANCGFSEVSDDAGKAVSLMLKMYKEKQSLREYGENGFRYATEHFSKEVCVDKLESLFRS